MYRLQVKTHFDAAHFLRDYEGKCRRMHGHRWEVEVCLQGEKLDSRNMLVDFGDVKDSLEALIEEHLDHYCLNDSLHEADPTAEYLAKWVFEHFEFTEEVDLVRVCVWESPNCCVKYSPSMESVSEGT